MLPRMSSPLPPAGPDAVPSETLSYGRDLSPERMPEEEPGSGLTRGSRVHRYTILDRVGEGGMGIDCDDLVEAATSALLGSRTCGSVARVGS